MDTKILQDIVMEKFLCSLYRIRYNNCRVHFLLFTFFCFSLSLEILELANASHDLFSPFVLFSTVLLQIKLWARPLFFFFRTFSYSLWDSERGKHKSVGKKKKSGKVVRSVLSSAVHESKSVQKQHVKIELENQLLQRNISSFPLFLYLLLSLSHTHTLTLELWKIEYSE